MKKRVAARFRNPCMLARQLAVLTSIRSRRDCNIVSQNMVGIAILCHKIWSIAILCHCKLWSIAKVCHCKLSNYQLWSNYHIWYCCDGNLLTIAKFSRSWRTHSLYSSSPINLIPLPSSVHTPLLNQTWSVTRSAPKDHGPRRNCSKKACIRCSKRLAYVWMVIIELSVSAKCIVLPS